MTAALPILKGTLDTLVLRAISREPLHGFEITTWLEAQSAGSLDVEDSALYQALYRLEKRRLVTAEWGVTANNRRARYYRITSRGRVHLKAEIARWLQYATVVTGVLTRPASA